MNCGYLLMLLVATNPNLNPDWIRKAYDIIYGDNKLDEFMEETLAMRKEIAERRMSERTAPHGSSK